MMLCASQRSAQWIAQSRAGLADAAPVFVYFFNHTLEVIQLFVPNKVRGLDLVCVCV
jgi:hypothetical protein